jgi:hypothetical protein
MEYVFAYDKWGDFVAMYNILEDFEYIKETDIFRSNDSGYSVIVNSNESIEYFIKNAPVIGTKV